MRCGTRRYSLIETENPRVGGSTPSLAMSFLNAIPTGVVFLVRGLPSSGVIAG